MPTVPASEERHVPLRLSLVDAALASDDIEAAVTLDRLVLQGLQVESLEAHPNLTRMMVAQGVLPKSTLQHNTKRAGGRLSPGNSERVVRTLRIRSLARDAFGDGNADAWLETPLKRFDGRTPMNMLATESGARAVERLIERTLHGFNA